MGEFRPDPERTFVRATSINYEWSLAAEIDPVLVSAVKKITKTDKKPVLPVAACACPRLCLPAQLCRPNKNPNKSPMKALIKAP